MDATTLNTIVGVIGIIVGIIGAIVGVIGWKSLETVKNINKIKVGKQSTVNQAIYNGMTYTDVKQLVTDEIKPFSSVINNIDDLQKILEKNNGYRIPVMWFGTQEEYNKLLANREIIDDVVYMIT